MQKKILFIINPASGASNKEHFQEWIKAGIDSSVFDLHIALTTGPKHATTQSMNAAADGFDIVVAVGGDGSVNEVADGLNGTTTSLGIIPTGSGNGITRHLGIPMNFKQALNVFHSNYKDRIDTLKVNDHFCIGTFGIGFDAHIAHLFAKAKKRGYSTYVKLVLSEFYKYQIRTFAFEVDGIRHEKECFLLTFANSSQFGNNATIAPYASVKDGIIDISIMKKFPVRMAPHLIYRLMNNSLGKSRYFEALKGKEILILNQGSLQGHIDGEPVELNDNIRIEIIPASLNVIIPSP